MGTVEEVFDADEAVEKARADFPSFAFKWKGEKYYLPNMALLSTDEAVELAEALQGARQFEADPKTGETVGDPEEFFHLIELLNQIVGDEDTAAAIRDMPGAILGQVLVRWEAVSMENMGDLGKGDSPPSARNRAERRSKSTSADKAKTSGASGSTRSGRKSAA